MRPTGRAAEPAAPAAEPASPIAETAAPAVEAESAEQRNRAGQSFWSVVVGVPAIFSVLRLGVEAGGELQTTLLLVANVDPINLIAALFTTAARFVSATLVGVLAIGGVALASRTPDQHRPALFARWLRAAPLWFAVAAFGLAAITWQIMYLPLLFPCAVAAFQSIVTIPRDARWTVAAGVVAGFAAYAWLVGPTVVAAARQGDWLVFLLFTASPALALGIPGPLPRRFVGALTLLAQSVALVMVAAAAVPMITTPVLPLTVTTVARTDPADQGGTGSPATGGTTPAGGSTSPAGAGGRDRSGTGTTDPADAGGNGPADAGGTSPSDDSADPPRAPAGAASGSSAQAPGPGGGTSSGGIAAPGFPVQAAGPGGVASSGGVTAPGSSAQAAGPGGVAARGGTAAPPAGPGDADATGAGDATAPGRPDATSPPGVPPRQDEADPRDTEDILGHVITVDDVNMVILQESGGVRYVPTGLVLAQVLCPTEGELPRYRLWVRGFHVEDSLLEGLGRQVRPASRLDAACRNPVAG